MSPRALTAMLRWRYALVAGTASLLVALVIGLPTDVIPNPWFTRMTPVRTLDMLILPVTSVLVGALLATYVAWPTAAAPVRGGPHAGLMSGALGWLAIGCPVCNKLIVALLGISGAVSYFQPLQPLLGLCSILLSAWALRVRLRTLAGCPIPATRPSPT